MEEFNKRAISEVIEILNHTDKEIVEKIPQKFINFLFENADNDYKPNINFYDDDWKNSVQDDTQAILALIYRDYIVSDDERKELLKEEQEDKLKREKELQEKYNPDNLFKKKTVEMVKKMLDKKLDIELISELSELNEKEIKEIAKEK